MRRRVVSRKELIDILKKHGYRKYPDQGSHQRMYLPGDCTTAVHIPRDNKINNNLIRRIERKTRIKMS